MGRILPGDLGDAFAPTKARAISRRLPFWERAADRFLTPQTAGKVADYYMAYSALQGGESSPGAVEEGGKAAAALFAPGIAQSRVAAGGSAAGGTGTIKERPRIVRTDKPGEQQDLSHVESLLQNIEGRSAPAGGMVRAPGKFPETRQLSDAQAAEPLSYDPVRKQQGEDFARQYLTAPDGTVPAPGKVAPTTMTDVERLLEATQGGAPDPVGLGTAESPIIIKSPPAPVTRAGEIARQRVPAPSVPIPYSQSRPDPDAVRAPDAPKFQNYGEAKERAFAAGTEAQDAYDALAFERSSIISTNPVMRDQAYRWVKNLVTNASRGTDEEVARVSEITRAFPTYNARLDGRLYRLPEEEEAALMAAYFDEGMPAQDRQFIDSGHPHLVKAVDDAVANTQGLRSTLQEVGRETLGGRGQMALEWHQPAQQKWIVDGPKSGGKLRPDGHNPKHAVWTGVSVPEDAYRDLIRSAAEETAARYSGVDAKKLEHFLVSIGRTENIRRDPGAISPKGPVGLWQFTANTWRQASQDYPGEDFELGDRVDPAISTAVAADYIAGLLLKYNNDVMKAALAYNQGETFAANYYRGKIKLNDPDMDAKTAKKLDEGLRYQASTKKHLGRLALEETPLPTGGIPGVLGMSMSPQAQTDSTGFGPPETDTERLGNSLRTEPLTSPPLDLGGPQGPSLNLESPQGPPLDLESPPLNIPGPESELGAVSSLKAAVEQGEELPKNLDLTPFVSEDYDELKSLYQFLMANNRHNEAGQIEEALRKVTGLTPEARVATNTFLEQQEQQGAVPSAPATAPLRVTGPSPTPAAPAEAPAAQDSAAPGQAVIEGKPVTDTQGAPVTQVTVDRVLTQLDKLGSLEAQRVFVENSLRRPNLRPEEANALLVGAQALRGYIKPKTMAEALAQVRSGINPGDQWFNTVTRGMSIDRTTTQEIADKQAEREFLKKRRAQILDPDKGGIAKQQKDLASLVQRSVYDKITQSLDRIEQAQKKDTKLNVAAFKKRIDRYKQDLSDLQRKAAMAITKGAGKSLSQEEYEKYVEEVNEVLVQLSEKITGVDNLISPKPKSQVEAGAGVSPEAAAFMAGRKQ